MKKRTFDEMVSYFNRKVADMEIDRKYKMELLGMITAILQKHDETIEPQRWIPCSERLPEVHWFDRDICYSDTVLVTEETKYGSKDVKMGYRTTEGGGEIWWDAQEGAGFAGEIIAWMPLPEPY